MLLSAEGLDYVSTIPFPAETGQLLKSGQSSGSEYQEHVGIDVDRAGTVSILSNVEELRWCIHNSWLHQILAWNGRNAYIFQIPSKIPKSRGEDSHQSTRVHTRSLKR